jgi:hypothetical protein
MKTQLIQWADRTFNISNVKASQVELNGEEVLKVERDLAALPFDVNNLAQTVDEPTFVTLKDVDIQNGVIEVKVLNTIIDSTAKTSGQDSSKLNPPQQADFLI